MLPASSGGGGAAGPGAAPVLPVRLMDRREERIARWLARAAAMAPSSVRRKGTERRAGREGECRLGLAADPVGAWEETRPG